LPVALARWIRGITRMIICVLLWGGGIGAEPAAAQNIDFMASEVIFRDKPLIGMGSGLAPDYEGSGNFRFYPLPQARFNWADGCYINLLGPVIRVDVIPSRTFGFGPIGRYRPERGSVEDEKVRLLGKVDAAMEAGMFGTLTFGRFFLYTAANWDTGDAHGGFTADVSAGCRVRIERHVRMVFQAVGTWADDNYMDAYFSVNAENARKADLPEFTAGSGIKDVGVVVALKYNINWHWGITGVCRYTRLLGDAADSPLVDRRGDRNQFTNGIIVNYNF
jgi:MipA family protein